MSNVTRILAAVLLAAFSVGPVSAATVSNAPATVAQTAGGTVQGTVQDETGAPVSGATVFVHGANSYTATTDAKGAFTLSNINQGLYSVEVRKAGYDTATESDLAIASGVTQTVSVRLHGATLTSLRTIASVRAVGHGSFNTSTAAVNSVPAQVFQDQGQPQVTRVLNQIPGVQISLPNGSANAAVPGAITFPNIRNGLAFETATLIDGHPLSVGLYGDYVTTFLNSYVLGNSEVIKGPGAMSPQVNYAIGGTMNFRTKDPTLTATPDYTFGVTSRGGTFFNVGVSDTVLNNRLGFVVDLAGINDPSPLNGTSVYYDPTFGNPAFVNGQQLFGSASPQTIPGTASTAFSKYTFVTCCFPIYGDYNNLTELVKARYKFSGATTGTVSYLGSQTTANQTGNTTSLLPGTFAPGAGYTGSLPSGSLNVATGFFLAGGTGEKEINNEPILQAEVSTTLNNDTVLARYYHATINRTKYSDNSNPLGSTTVVGNMYGTLPGFAPFNGASTAMQVYDYYNNPEVDRLSGYSFQYSHPINDGDLTFSMDTTNSQTVVLLGGTKYNFNHKQCPGNEAQTFCLLNSVSLPTGASQNFTTYLLRGQKQLTPKVSATLSLYENVYRSTYPTNCTSPQLTTISATVFQQSYCQADGTVATTQTTNAGGVYTTAPVSTVPLNFQTTTRTHFDPRLGLEWRPRNDWAVRFAAGSSIAPPYINLLSQATGAVAYSSATGVATQSVNAGTILPETAFGYNLGVDKRLKDGVTVISADVYRTNLRNQFIKQVYPSPYTCANSPYACPGTAPASAPVYYSSYVNLTNARYEGLELSIKRNPAEGFGFTLAGSTQRAYAYNLPHGFYCASADTAANPCGSASNPYNTNLAIVSGANFTGGAVGSGLNGVSNQSVPYLQGNLELNYRLKNGAFASFGETLYGKNNSYNEPPFGIAYASLRYPLNKTVSIQVSGDNIFNAWSGLFPITGGGVTIPLANGLAGATYGNVVGPSTYRFMLTKTLGAFSDNTNP